MVGHNDIFTQFDKWEMPGYCFPKIACNYTNLIQNHGAINHIAKKQILSWVQIVTK